MATTLRDHARSEPQGYFTVIRALRQASQAGRFIKNISFLETIADAIQRFDHLEIVVNDLEFLAQALDVAVDGAVIHVDLVVIGRVHQRVAALNHAGPGGERLKDKELGDGQRYGFALPGAGVALGGPTAQAGVEALRRRERSHAPTTRETLRAP